MKGDFSRLPPPGRPYSGVWMQQGRVQLDQDWNEQLVIESGRSRTALRDVIGASGAPVDDPGFRIRARGGLHPGGHILFEADLELDVVFPGGELTVEVRVVVEETQGGGVLVEVEGLFILRIDDQGRPVFHLGAGDGPALASPEPLARDAPVLVSAAYDGRVAVLHLDGRPVAAIPVQSPPRPAKTAALRLGGTRGAGGEAAHGFGGAMDEVRLWSHARTPAQLRQTAGRTLTGAEEGLAAYFPLDEGDGAIAHDAAGGRHARLVGGHAPEWGPHALMIGSGRLYVDGILCVEPHEVPYAAQPELPGAPPLGPGRHLLYVDVWERYLSAAEDPALREVALGGLDTTGRTRTISQVRQLPLAEGEGWREAILRLQRKRRRSALAARRVFPGAPAAGNRLYRVEVFGSGGPYGWPRPAGATDRAARVTAIERAEGGGGTLTLRPAHGLPGELHPGQQVEIFTRADEGSKQPGFLAGVTAVEDRLHQVTVDLLPPGLELADEPRVRAVATFLWSEDNAWRAYPVRHLERATGMAVLGDVGPQGLELVSGDLVELTDDRTVLLALPGVLRTVRDVDHHTETVTLDSPVPLPALAGSGLLLRRWSRGRGPAAALPVTAGWTQLSDGVEVQFQGTAFRSADYWTIPMRVAEPTGLEWPEAGNRPAALPPQGIEHRYAALATVVVHPHARHRHAHRIEVEDHRSLFEPLVALTREERRSRDHHHHDHHHEHGHDHDHHEHDHHHEHGHDHHHHHEHDHGGDEERVDVLVEGAGEVEVDVSEDGDGGAVDVSVDVREDPRGEEEVEVSVDAHGAHGHADEVDVTVDADGAGGEEIEVSVDAHGRHGEDEEVRVVVHAAPAVPAGCWIFGESAAAPEGFAATGARLTLPRARPAWEPRTQLPAPFPGQVRCAALDGAVYAFADGTREVLRYAPDADAWRVETSLPEAWRSFAVAALDGRIHLVGGMDAHGRVVDWHRAYHPATGAWERRAKLGSPRCDMGAAGLGGLLYVAGGLRAFLSLTSSAVDAYDPAADAWTGRRAMRHGRSSPGVAAAGARLYVIGGRRPGMGEGRPSDKAESYDPDTGRWKELDDVPTPRLDAALAELDGTLYLVGGEAGGRASRLTQAYVPGDGWTGAAELETARTGLGLAALPGRLLAVGGSNQGGATASVEACRLFYDLHGYRKE